MKSITDFKIFLKFFGNRDVQFPAKGQERARVGNRLNWEGFNPAETMEGQQSGNHSEIAM